MSNFKDRLRELAVKSNDGYLRGPAMQAADHIEELEAENVRLRKRVEAANRLADKINTLQISGNRVDFPALDEALDAYRATKEQK